MKQKVIKSTTEEAKNLSVAKDVLISIPLSEWPIERLRTCWHCGTKIANPRGFYVETMHGSNEAAVPEGYKHHYRSRKIPRSKGGTKDAANMIDSCFRCIKRFQGEVNR